MWLYSWAIGHLEVVLGRGAGELARGVVVVEHQVAVQVARQPVPLRALAAVGRRVAEESAADLVEVDVGLAAARRPCGRRSGARASRACRSRSSGRVRRPPAPARRSRGCRRRRCRRGWARRCPRRPSARRSGACRRASAAPRARCRRCGWDRGDRSAAPPGRGRTTGRRRWRSRARQRERRGTPAMLLSTASGTARAAIYTGGAQRAGGDTSALTPVRTPTCA